MKITSKKVPAKTATAIMRAVNMRGDAILFEVSPPYYSNKYIISSAIDNEFGMETYLFAADEHGKVVNWTELPGSTRWVYDPYRPLADEGYTVKRL